MNGAATLPNLRLRQGPLAFSAVRDFHEHAMTEDYLQDAGFLCVAMDAGDVVIRCLSGLGDITATVAAGAWVGPRGDTPCALQAIRAAGTTVCPFISCGCRHGAPPAPACRGRRRKTPSCGKWYAAAAVSGGVRWRSGWGEGCSGTRTRARYLMRGQRDLHSRSDPRARRARTRWTEEKEEALWDARGYPLDQLAACHGRSPCAISARSTALRNRYRKDRRR